jgi:hypothetical protein
LWARREQGRTVKEKILGNISSQGFFDPCPIVCLVSRTKYEICGVKKICTVTYRVVKITILYFAV